MIRLAYGYHNPLSSVAITLAMETKIGTTFRNTKVTLHQYYNQSVGHDVSAVYHQDYRHVYLQEYPPSYYAHGRASGNMDDDGCSYYRPHHYWSMDRSDWPPVLFQYEARISVRGRNKPGQLVTPEGWLVLDLNSKPVKDFRMPFALSSKPEPYLLEAIMRENYDGDMQVQDLRARMPGILVNGADKIRTGTISMAMSRFRLTAGLISWQGKIGSDAMKDYLDALLPPHCLAANSTQDFRNLYPHEVEEMKLINAGCFPNKQRADNRDFSDSRKQQVFETVAERYRRKRRAFDGSTEFTSTFYKVQKARAEREGRSNSDMETDSQDSDKENHHDAREYDSGEEYEEAPDIDMDSDADYIESVPHTPETVIDFRELCPTTHLQIDLISMMLEPSRLQYFFMTGLTAPPRASCESYLTQYDRLQSALNIEIREAGVEDYKATLIGLTVWTDQEWTWNGPWCSEAFGTLPDQDQVSAKVLAVKDELAGEEISTEVEAMTTEEIESIDYSLLTTVQEGLGL